MDLHKMIREQLKRAVGADRAGRTNLAAAVNIGKDGASTAVTSNGEVTVIDCDGEVTVIRHDEDGS